MSRKVKSTKEVFNSMGGGDAVISMLKKMGYIKFLDKSLGKRNSRAEFSYGTALIMWFCSVYSGAKRLEDIYHFRETLKAHPQLKRGISPDTLSKIIKELSIPSSFSQIGARPDIYKDGNERNINPKLNRLLIETAVSLGLLKKGVSYTLDFDTTSIFTKIRDGRKIYEGKGKRGYSNALCAVNNIPVYFEIRGGNSSPKFRLITLICEALDCLNSFGINVGRVRVDGAAYSKQFVNEMNRRKILFVTRVKKRVIPKNISLRKGFGIEDYVDEFRYKFGHGKERVVLHSNNLDYTGGLITNDYNSTKEYIITNYRERAHRSEGVFRSLKDEFMWELPAMRKLEHNSTFMIVQALCYTVFRYLTRELSTKLKFVRENMELKTFRSDFMYVVQKWAGKQMQFFHMEKNYDPVSVYV